MHFCDARANVAFRVAVHVVVAISIHRGPNDTFGVSADRALAHLHVVAVIGDAVGISVDKGAPDHDKSVRRVNAELSVAIAT